MYVRIIPKPVCLTISDSAVCWSDTFPLAEHNCCYFAVILNYRSPKALDMRESKRGGRRVTNNGTSYRVNHNKEGRERLEDRKESNS